MQIVDLRSTYNTEYPDRIGGNDAITMFIAHHAQAARPGTQNAAQQMVASIDNYHKTGNGWPGFAYHGAVWQDVFFRCKDWSRLGYHSAGMDISPRNGIGDNNDHGVAVVWLGDYTNTVPGDIDIATMREVYQLAQSELGRELPLLGHQDVWATECPGHWWSSGKARLLDSAAPGPADPGFTPREVGLISAAGYLSGDVVRIEDRTARLNEANRVRRENLGMAEIPL